MDWIYLGHAMWMLLAGELRILFDPQLLPTHHGDVFEVRPRRRVHAEALRADFIVVSHCHPDHFDVPSLRRLAQLDDESVVITSDPLVERCCKQLGFRKVVRLAALQRIELDGVTLLTTPSFGDAIEWGIMAANSDGVVWNQVDSVFGGVERVREILAQAADGLARPALRDRLDFGLVRWQPLLEVESQLAERRGFPWGPYRDTLQEVAALQAAAIVPASAGTRHAAAYEWLNRSVYPVAETRFRADVEATVPGILTFPGTVGCRFRLRNGVVNAGREGTAELVTLDEQVVSERFRPLDLPPLTDPNMRRDSPQQQRVIADAWIAGELCPALAQAYPDFGTRRSVCFVLEIVYADGREVHALDVAEHGVEHRRGFRDDYDVLNAVAGSYLVDVIEGRRHWGEPLLGGMLRALQRAYDATPAGVRKLNIGVAFLYYALSYDDSHARWVDWQLSHPEAGDDAAPGLP